MQISIHSFVPGPHSIATRVPLVTVLLALACTETKEADPGVRDSARPSGPTTLVIDLPAGVEVSIDGRERRKAPVAPIEVEPGEHTITLSTACQQVEIEVDAVAHQATRVDRTLASGLGFATIEIRARDLKGAALEHSVAIDGVVVGGGKETSRTVLPACKYRVRVANGDLGGFIEDIDLGKTAEVRREVVLAPGPDMIRLKGGKFNLGVPRELWGDEYWGEYAWGELHWSKIPVELEAFDIDKTEVTAGQWMACRKAGGCKERETQWWSTKHPGRRDLPHCNVDTLKMDPILAEGRDSHPMNCVARWEAEDYCRWAGKRLPTANEWEYAARSGDSSYIWPWGRGKENCDHGEFRSYLDRCPKPRSTSPVCSHPMGDTDQGACDFVGNVIEYVQWSKSGKAEGSAFNVACMGNGWRSYHAPPIEGHSCLKSEHQVADVGFRCARSVSTMLGGSQ